MPVSFCTTLFLWYIAPLLTHRQIGDLLASISGTNPPASNALPKRKAEDELKPAPKIARKEPPPSKPAQTSRPLGRQEATPKPTNGAGIKSSTPVSRLANPTNGTQKTTKPPTPCARPSPTTPASNSPSVSKAAPKRGSYAEVLARAKKAQEAMGQVGKIQHKKVDKRERPPVLKQDSRIPGKKPAGPSGYKGTAKAGPRSGLNGSGANGDSSRDPRGKGPMRPGTGARVSKISPEEPEKKVKKAAQVTTGYSGTARPPPSAKPKRDQPRGGALLNRQPARPRGHSGSRYEDDYDEELDDFIEYDDDDDDQGGPRYQYDSDGSSDMEAGLDELTGEERMAERIARREDIEEERLEKSLKAAKEERKRKALEALRAKKH